MHLSFGVTFNHIANFLMSVALKEFGKLANIWHVIRKTWWSIFSDSQCISCYKEAVSVEQNNGRGNMSYLYTLFINYLVYWQTKSTNTSADLFFGQR